MKRNASIGQRLGVGFGLLLLMMLGLLALVDYWQSQSASAETAFVDTIQPLHETALGLERAVLYVGIGTRAYLLRPDPARLQVQTRNVENARARLRELGELRKGPGSEALYRELMPRVERYLTGASVLIGRGRAGANDVNAEMVLADDREAALASLRSFSDMQEQRMRAALSEMNSAREWVSDGLTVAAVLALAFFLILAYFTVQSIRRPARELLRVAAALRDGDWKPAMAWAPRADAVHPARNEMAQIGQAFGTAAVALERREQRLRADREVAGATASSLSKEAVAEAALAAVAGHVGAEVGAFYWRERESHVLRPIAARALDPSCFRSVAIGEGVPGQAAKERRVIVLRDIPADSPFAVKLGYDQAPPRAVVAVPIVFHDQLLAVLLLASLRDFDADAVAFLDAAGGQLGVGFHNVVAHEEIQRLLRELGEKNDEVQAQNEELQVQNEEIQAQNEEIQAQNEELQAQGEEIQTQNEELKHHAEQLRRHTEVLADANRRKNEFLGLLAHELRNPMASISNSLYLLTRSQPDSEQVQRAQAVIDRQTRQLTRLVDDLLDTARISSGKIRLQREWLDLAQLVRDCMEDYRPALDRAGLVLELRVPDAPVPFYGDRARLGQILGNLMDNAMKFTNAGQRIAVALRELSRPAGVSLSVADTGIGIDPALLPRLTEPFAQADSSLERSRGGLGLGLALVKGLVDLHGGTLSVRSDGPGKGAEFVVQLPLSDDRTQDRDASAASNRSDERPRVPRRILIVEDNVDAADSLRDAMACSGHEVHVAYTALDALAAARDFRPDIVLCDIGLPTVDGYEFARRLRQDDGLRTVFLIAMTGYAADSDKERAAQAGFDRHLAKPVRIEMLNEILSECGPAGRTGGES